MSNSSKYFAGQLNLQTKLFNNATVGVSDADSTTRLNDHTNHIAWLSGHVVSTRYMLASVFGLSAQEPFPTLFTNGKGLDPDATYPSMAELRKDWDSISAQLASAVENLTEEALGQKMPNPVPTGDTLGDFLNFILHHEAYTIGQLGIARKFFGLEAMKYN